MGNSSTPKDGAADWIAPNWPVPEGTAGSRKTAVVKILDLIGAPVKTYEFDQCWVKSVETSGFKAGGNEGMTEKFVMTYTSGKVS